VGDNNKGNTHMNKELVFIYHLRKPIWKYHLEVVEW